MLLSWKTQCFSWRLLQLIFLSVARAPTYYGLASDPLVQKILLGNSQPEGRTDGQKIKRIIDALTNPEHWDSERPHGRRENDFVDIRKITVLPTPDERASTAPPYLCRTPEIDQCPESERLAIHIESRLLCEDTLQDLRKELQVAVGSRKSRRKGLLIDCLTMGGIECDKRRSWS